MGIARNSLNTFLIQSCSLLIGIISSIIVCRMLGPDYRGVYFLLSSMTSLVVAMGNFGLDFTNTYLLAKKKYSLAEINAQSIYFSLLAAILVIMVYWLGEKMFARFVLPGVEKSFIMFSLLLLPFSFYNQFWNGMMLGTNNIRLINIVNAIFLPFGLVTVFLALVVFKWGLWGVLIQNAILSLLLISVKLTLLHKLEKIKFSFNFRLLQESLYFGFRGQIGNIAGNILSRLDAFIVNYFTGLAGVGNYSLASSLSQKLFFVTNPITMSSTSLISSLDRRQSAELTSRVIRHTTYLALFLALIIILSCRWLVPFFYGQEYQSAIRPLQILVIGLIPEIIALIIALYITGQLGRPQWGSAIAWIDLLVFILLSLWLGPKYHLLGISLALAITYFGDGLIFVYLFMKNSNQNLRKIFIPRVEDWQFYHQQFRNLIWNSRKRLWGYGN